METIEFYRSRLRTNKHTLDDELEVQSEFYDRIARHVSHLEDVAARAEDDYQKEKARLFDDFMREAVTTGRKVTVDQANSVVRRNADRGRLWERRADAQRELRDWQNLLEAWKGKGFNLRDLAGLFAADYFGRTQVSIRGQTNAELVGMVDRNIRDRRAEMHAKRERRTL